MEQYKVDGPVRKYLLENGMTEDNISKFFDHIKFNSTIFKIQEYELANHIESSFFNDKTREMSLSTLKEIFNEYLERLKKNQHKIKKIITPSINTNQSGNNGNSSNEKLEIIFNQNLIYNKDRYSNERYVEYNPNPVDFQLTEDLIVSDYTIIPKDDEDYLEEYKSYFRNMKSKFLKAFNVDELDPTLDQEKFVLLVRFDSTEGKPLINELTLVDPLKDYLRYTIKFENELKEILFTGQIVFVVGRLKTSEIQCENIFTGIPDFVNVLKEQSALENYRKSNNPYNFQVLAGPFFPNSSVDLDVFTNLLMKTSKENPSVVFFLGPFVPEDNNLVESGVIIVNKTVLSYNELFIEMIRLINHEFKDKLNTTVVICPSLLDVHKPYPLPQPPFDTSAFVEYEMFKSNRLKFIGNPQLLFINNIIFAVINYDVTKEIIANSLISSSKIPMDSALESIIMQRSMLPLMPSVISQDEAENEKALTVDYRHYYRMTFVDYIPDIIITPSHLTQFGKLIKNSLFFNPGNVFRSQTLGSYLSFNIYKPINNSDLGIPKRVKADLIKLSKINSNLDNSSL